MHRPFQQIMVHSDRRRRSHKTFQLILVNIIIYSTGLINPFMPSGLFYLNSLDGSISNTRVKVIFNRFIEIPVSNANNVDPDQTPHSVASDLCLHCLPMP